MDRLPCPATPACPLCGTLRALRVGTPQPVPPPPDEGVTVRAGGGGMLYGRGTEATAFQTPNVVPGQERLDEGGALSSPP